MDKVYNPRVKRELIQAHAINTLGIEFIMGCLKKYHNDGQSVYENPRGTLVLSDVDDEIHARMENGL